MDSNVPPQDLPKDCAEEIDVEESDRVFRRVEKMLESGSLDEAEVLVRPVLGIDGERYTPEDFVAKFGG